MSILSSKIIKYAAYGMSMLLVACTNDLYKDDVPTPETDPIHGSTNATFTTTKTTRLTVLLNDEFDGMRYYTVEVFTLNPILFPNEAKVISGSSLKVNKDLPYEDVELHIPDMLDNIYVCVTNPRGYKKVYECAVKEGTMICDTEAGFDTKANALRNAYKPDFTPEAGAVEIKSKADWDKNINYTNQNWICKITGEIDLASIPHNVAKIYVANGGKIKGLSNINGRTNPFIRVLNGGTIEFTGEPSLGNCDIAIQKGGTVTGNVFNITSGAKLYNGGLLEVNKINVNNGSVTIYNACQMKCHTFLLGSGATLNLLESSYLEAEKEFKLVQGTVSLDAHAQIKTPLFQLSSNTIKIKSPADIGSLIWADRIQASDGGGVRNTTVEGIVELYAKNGFNLPNGSNITGNVTNGSDGKGASTPIPTDTTCNPVGNKGESEDDGFTEDSETSDLIEGDTQPYTYMFEDNWPDKGDYDMNDVVINVTFSNNTTDGEKVMAIDVKLCAIGAKKKLGVAFQIDGLLASDVTNFSGSEFSTLESGHKYTVVRLLEDVHQAFEVEPGTFVNTTGMEEEARYYSVKLKLRDGVKGTVNVKNFNLFLVTGDMNANRRAEIHLPMFKGTDRANVSKEYKYITPDDNLMWGLYVPTIGGIRYPKERVNLVEAFEGVSSWLEGGTAPWYANPIPGKVVTYDVSAIPMKQ